MQVHPDETRVGALHPGEGAKTEAWLVLDAQPGSLIYAGLRAGVGPAELRAALRHGTVADCLHRFTPQPGDFLFLPAGTVHAAGGGLLLAEIQETSDATFRLYDWDRRDAAGQPRLLHVEQALACIDWKQGPSVPLPRAAESAQEWDQELLRCPQFVVGHTRRVGAFPVGGAGVLTALIVAEGQGRLANGEFVMAGDAWIMPAQMPPMLLHPEPALSALMCSLP